MSLFNKIFQRVSMTLIPVNTQISQALETNNIQKIEKLFLDSDIKKELILDFIDNYGKESLINLLPKFKSKGLVLNIKAILEM